MAKKNATPEENIMFSIDLIHPVYNLDETPEQYKMKPAENQVTVRKFLREAILANAPGAGVDEKLRRYELCMEMTRADTITLTEEDVEFLRQRVGEAYSTLIVGQVVPILNNAQRVYVKKKGH